MFNVKYFIEKTVCGLITILIVVCVSFPNGVPGDEKVIYSGKVEDKTSNSTNEAFTGSFSIKNNPFKYSEYYSDTESAMCYCQARYYSSGLMRFINRDTYDPKIPINSLSTP
jgi:RHS repeat-associated protein